MVAKTEFLSYIVRMKKLNTLLLIAVFLLSFSCVSWAMSFDANQDDSEEDSEELSVEPTPEPAPEAKAEDVASGAACPVGSPNEGPIEDDSEAAADRVIVPETAVVPYEDLSTADLRQMILDEPEILGSMSVGATNSGAQFNSVPLPSDAMWDIVNPIETWGSQETVDFIQATIRKVNADFPDTPVLYVGDISDKNGGSLNRHLSHQSGRDVDLGWYFKAGKCSWWVVGTTQNLDLARTWAFIRAQFTETDVEMIFIDKRIQTIFYNYALEIGEDRDWVRRVFQYPHGNPNGIIRHARGHATHLHVRYYNRKAQELGRRAYPILLKQKKIKPPTYYIYHRVRKGQTLGHLAQRYGTSVSSLRRANRLRSNMIRAGKSYRIPRRGGVKGASTPIAIPARLIPPPIPGQQTASESAVAKAGPSKIDAAEPTIDSVKINPIAGGIKNVADLQPPMKPETTPPVFSAEELAKLEAEKPTPEPTPEPTPAPVVKPKPKKKSSHRWITYKVRSGDNLWSIARRYDLHVKDIKRWNKLKSNALKPGQKLRMYVKRKK
jgi:penicillin-insensitive murein endopeptidase